MTCYLDLYQVSIIDHLNHVINLCPDGSVRSVGDDEYEHNSVHFYVVKIYPRSHMKTATSFERVSTTISILRTVKTP